MASLGTSLDFYPFPNHGLHFSPGVLIHNPFLGSNLFQPKGGTSFTLNGHTYYQSSNSGALGVAMVNQHRLQAFTMTTGWGNMIPRRGGRFSFPVELGVAFLGSPVVNFALIQGQLCDAQGQNCHDVNTDPGFQGDLQALAARYQKDLAPLKTYPIASFGIAYSFQLRPNAH